MSIIAKLSEQKDFSLSEIKIADYILDNKETVLHYTVRDLAKATYTGTATVMRMIKKVYDGSFSDFKVDLAYEFQNNNYQESNFQIKKQETAFSIIEKIAKVEKDTIDQTKYLMDYQQIERVTKMINKANRICIITDGINEQTGNEFKYMMARIGKGVDVVIDSSWLALNCLDETVNPLVIYINHRKRNKPLLEKMQINHDHHIQGICISGYKNNIIETCCKEVIMIPTGVSFSDLAPVIYISAIRYVLNVLVSCVIATNYEICIKKLVDYSEYSRKK